MKLGVCSEGGNVVFLKKHNATVKWHMKSYKVAEAEEGIATIPVILEVAEVEVEITISVGVDIRHPVVTVGTTARDV